MSNDVSYLLDKPPQECGHMCRSIKQLRQPDRFPTDEEIQAAALQFVRKVSGYRVPSRANDIAFQRAVQEISAATHRLLNDLVTKS
jgi:hypothetical protein